MEGGKEGQMAIKVQSFFGGGVISYPIMTMVTHISELEESHKRPLQVSELISELLLKLSCFFFLNLPVLSETQLSVLSLQISNDLGIPGSMLHSTASSWLTAAFSRAVSCHLLGHY